ncbi:acetate/propionate family kinase [Caulobacter sp. S45]|uniref:acetate/propionate family kinase n=1 Tax=Caulobacter sp. S45 TaxID=1641861 RepID=UPI00131DD431|nr:acetate/propionate family kinase [Caulobacter sp. S45]
MASTENQVVLSLNCGSSSFKFTLFNRSGDVFEVQIEGEAEAIGTPQSRFSARDKQDEIVSEVGSVPDHQAAAARLFDLLDERGASVPSVIGHRIVHGGPDVRGHCVVDARVLRALEAARVFAPLHAPAALSVLAAARERFSERPHVACLDTAFHRNLPEVARRFPMAESLLQVGIERYGFHGLSCESILRQLGGDAPRRIVIAHLGGGSSITAVRAGQSIDTSMGLTPTGGVMMATRTGDLDPGLLIYLLREHGLDADGLEALVNRESGMKAVSGSSGDLRSLRDTTGDAARLAIDMYVYSVRKQIAAMSAALEGLDLLVFTGGIGQNDAQIRTDICSGLAWLGVREAGAHLVVGDPTPFINACALRANEEEEIARHAVRLTN